jgi:hypothetical protein
VKNDFDDDDDDTTKKEVSKYFLKNHLQDVFQKKSYLKNRH